MHRDIELWVPFKELGDLLSSNMVRASGNGPFPLLTWYFLLKSGVENHNFPK